MSESKHTTDEFVGNVCDEKGCQFRFKVTISEKEVRVWVKAIGKVVKSGGMDVMIIAKNDSHDALLEACEEAILLLEIGIECNAETCGSHDALLWLKPAIELAKKEG